MSGAPPAVGSPAVAKRGLRLRTEPPGRWLHLACLVAIALIAVSSFGWILESATPVTTDDLAMRDNFISGQPWTHAMRHAKRQERFFFLFARQLWYMPHWFSHPGYYRGVLFGANMLTLAAFLGLVRLLTRSWIVAYGSTCAAAAFVVFPPTYQATTGVVPGYLIAFVAAFGGLAFFVEAWRRRSMRLSAASAGCLLLSLLTTEMAFAVLPVLPLAVAVHEYFRACDDGAEAPLRRAVRAALTPAHLRFLAPHIAMIVVYLSVYAAFPLLVPDPHEYPGKSLSLHPGRALDVLVDRSFSLFPGVYYQSGNLRHLAKKFDPGFASERFDPGFVLSNIEILWLVKGALAAVVVVALMRYAKLVPSRTLLLIIVTAPLLSMLPNLLISITEKYQVWRVPYYFSYHSFLIHCVFLAGAAFFASRWFDGRPAWLHAAGAISLGLVVLVVSVTSDLGTSFTSLLNAQQGFRWEAMKRILASEEIDAARDDALIYVASDMRLPGGFPTFDPFVGHHLGRPLRFTIDAGEWDEARRTEPDRDLYVARVEVVSGESHGFFLLAPLARGTDPGGTPGTRSCTVWEATPGHRLAVHWIAPGAETCVVDVEGERTTVSAEAGGCFRFDYAGRRADDPVPIRIRSDVPFDPATVGIMY